MIEEAPVVTEDGEIASETEDWLFFEDQDHEDDDIPAHDETNVAFISRDGTDGVEDRHRLRW